MAGPIVANACLRRSSQRVAYTIRALPENRLPNALKASGDSGYVDTACWNKACAARGSDPCKDSARSSKAERVFPDAGLCGARAQIAQISRPFSAYEVN